MRDKCFLFVKKKKKHPFTQECFAPSLVDIDLLVLYIVGVEEFFFNNTPC